MKTVINSFAESDTSDKDNIDISKLSTDVLFSPTPQQTKVKIRFWSRYSPGPYFNPADLTMAYCASVTNSGSMKNWWSIPGFREWFLNQDEERERLRYLFNKGLSVIEQAFDDPAANLNAKVKAWEKIGEALGFFNKNVKERFSDDDINKMSEKELKAYLDKKGIIVKQEKVLDLNPVSTTVEPAEQQFK